MILFRCDSVYQLMNAIQIKMTLLKDESADLLLSDHTNFDPLSPALPVSYTHLDVYKRQIQHYIKKTGQKFYMPMKIQRETAI